MAIDFPNNPIYGNTYAYNSITWSWNGTAWDRQSTNVVGITGATGATGSQGVTGPVGDYVISFNGITGAVGITAGNQISLTQNGNIFSIGVIEGSTSGLDADTLRGVSGQRFLENLQTGLLYGGLISVNAGNTAQVDITAGAGIVVSPGASLTVYPIPTVTPVTWTAKTGVTLSGLTSSDETWLAIDSSGSLVQSNVAFTDAQYTSQIPLGAALHLSRTYIQLIKSYPHVSYAQPEQFDPFIRAFGNLKLSGHEITANGANLLVNRSAGKSYAMGRNYKNDPNNPNIVTDTSAIPVTTIYHFYRNGSGAFTTTINGAIVPGSLDDGTGTLDTVTPAKYTIQRIFYLPDQPTLLGVYYGRQEYNSITDAQANIPFEEFSESESTATQGIFCGWLIVQGNATALNDTATAKFVNAGLFRNTANIGGGGLAIASIDDLNDVTTTTPTNNQVLRWNSGTAQWVNSDISSLAVSSFNGLTGAVTGVTTSTANTFTALNSFNAGISASGATFSGVVKATAGVLTDYISPLAGAGSNSPLYVNTGGTSHTIIGDVAGDNNGTYVDVDDDTSIILLNAGTITLNGAIDTNSTAIIASTVTVSSGGAVLEWDGVGVAPIVFTVANTNTSANNILFNAAGGGTFAADIAVNGVRVGRGAGSVATNTVLGAGALSANTTGTSNIAIGSSALAGNTSGSLNIAIGSNALLINKASSNTAIGNAALTSATTGGSNTAIGSNALNQLNTGTNNCAIGSSALQSLTTGLNNIGIGSAALYYHQTTHNNLAIGTYSMFRSTTAGSCVAVGNSSLGGSAVAATTCTGSVAVGANALAYLETGWYNTAIGYNALLGLTSGQYNVGIGSGAGDVLTSGNRNIAIGTDALGAGVTTSDCVAVGHNALLLNRGDNNVAVGNYALDALTTGINNVALGSNAGSALTTGSNNFAIGSGALQVATTVSDNVAIGKDALRSKTTSGDGNVAIGTSALYQATTALTCTAVGYQSQFGSGAVTAQANSSLGYNSMVSILSGSYNAAFGSNTLYSLTSGSQNAALGVEALRDATTAATSTAVGTSSLGKTTVGSGNVGIGWRAGYYKTAADTNHVTAGDYSIYIGYQSRASADSVTKEIVIGGLNALGLGSNTTVIGTSTTLGNRIFGVASTGQVAPTIASAATIAPTTSIVFISGTAAVATITAPSTIATTGGQITLIPTGLFTTTAAGNIALASTAVVSKALIMTYDATTTKWYPSY